MDDIDKARQSNANNFNSTNTYTMFGETLMLNTQQRIILDMPTTLADRFEYLSSCDMATVPAPFGSRPSDGEHDLSVANKPCVFRVSDILLDYLTVLDILHLRMVCKSTA